MLISYLSDEWIAAAAELAQGSTIDPPIAGDGFSIETVVTGIPGSAVSPGGDSHHVIALHGSSIEIRRPVPDEKPNVRLTQSYEVSVRVATGELDAQTAFLNAEIQVSGDVSCLITNASAVAAVGDILAPLRNKTDYSISE